MTDDNVQHRSRSSKRSYDLNQDPSNNNSNDSFSIFENHERQRRRSQQRTSYGRKKSEVLMCSICDGPAHGYNFDAITCESCKAFFRRNALKPTGLFKCRMNDGQCEITISTRKRCKACRLAKCFEKGMRADWILTDEERINKRLKIEENRRLRQMLYPDSPDIDEAELMGTKNEPYDNDDMNISTFITPLTPSPVRFLSSEDLVKIQQIQQAYINSVHLTSLPSDIPSYPQSVRLTETSDMINLPTNIQATRLITYFKLLPEFASLNENDKLILTKYNTFTLAIIRAVLNYDPLTDSYHEPNTDDCVFQGRDLIQCFSLYQYEQSTKCVKNLVNASLNDRLLLQIFIIIILFSKGSAICTVMDEMEPIAQDILSIYQAQNVFIELLWKYCINKFGFTKTVTNWLKLTVSSMDAHLQAANTRQDYVKVDSVVDQLSPLMKSVMLID